MLIITEAGSKIRRIRLGGQQSDVGSEVVEHFPVLGGEADTLLIISLPCIRDTPPVCFSLRTCIRPLTVPPCDIVPARRCHARCWPPSLLAPRESDRPQRTMHSQTAHDQSPRTESASLPRWNPLQSTPHWSGIAPQGLMRRAKCVEPSCRLWGFPQWPSRWSYSVPPPLPWSRRPGWLWATRRYACNPETTRTMPNTSLDHFEPSWLRQFAGSLESFH